MVLMGDACREYLIACHGGDVVEEVALAIAIACRGKNDNLLRCCGILS
jgi:hypothetical protein